MQLGRRVLAQTCSSPKGLSIPSRRTLATARATAAAEPLSTGVSSLTIRAPDDWHLHVRDGSAMASVVPHTAEHYRRAIIMPNLTPPVTTAQAATEYRQRILACVPVHRAPLFQPLMTCYLTDRTSPAEVDAAKQAGVVAFKMYPAGATTNSDSGVTDILRVVPTLKHMADVGMPLLVHGEVTDPSVDMFDREAVFIATKLIPLLDQVPSLKVVMEHITTKDAAEFVASAPANIAATVTPQHMLLNRNSLFAKGLRPHNFCLPILKREKHRVAVAEAATSGSTKFFLGTDSAPHPKGAKEAACGCAGMYTAPVSLGLYATAFEAAGKLDNLEAFASHNGPDFYGLPRNEGSVTLVKQAMQIPDQYNFGDGVVVPMWAGEQLAWQVQP